MSRRIPNTFVIGAPKCGTTAIVHYLSAHPAVFQPYPKETGFWATDIHSNEAVSKINTLDEYLSLYADTPSNKSRLFDSSVIYLYSRYAVKNILDFNPDSRFIVMLRDPIELAYARHMEMLFNIQETVSDFETAWGLEAERSQGQSIPSACTDASKLFYRSVAAIGNQLERVMATVPRNQLFIGFFDDLKTDPLALYRAILDFLELSDDGRTEFEIVKPSRRHRFEAMGRLFQAPPPYFAAIMRLLKQKVRTGNPWLLRLIRETLVRDASRPPLSKAFRNELNTYFEPQIALVESLTGRDLSSWRFDDTKVFSE